MLTVADAIIEVPIDEVYPSPENDRIYDPINPSAPDFIALAKSVESSGVLDPNRVKEIAALEQQLADPRKQAAADKAVKQQKRTAVDAVIASGAGTTVDGDVADIPGSLAVGSKTRSTTGGFNINGSVGAELGGGGGMIRARPVEETPRYSTGLLLRGVQILTADQLAIPIASASHDGANFSTYTPSDSDPCGNR